MVRRPLWRAALIVLGVAVSAEAQAQAPAAASGRILYQLDVTTFQSRVGEYCHVTRGDGGIIVTSLAKTEAADCLLLPNLALMISTDFRLEATLQIRQKWPEGGAMGIVVGADRAKRYSYAALAFAIGKIGLGTTSSATTPWTILPAVGSPAGPRTEIGATNKAAIEVRGREMRGFLNDQLVASGTSAVPLDGTVGINVAGYGHEVLVTQFKVTSLAPPPTTTMTPSGGMAPTGSPGGADFKFTPGGTTLIDDDLSTVQRFTAKSAPCVSSYSEGGLLVTSGADGCEWELQHLNEAPTRARFELSMRLLKGEFFGLVFGQTKRLDDLHYHANIMADGRVNVNISQNGKSSPLIPWAQSAAVRTGTGATNRIAVEVLMQEIRFFINGQPVGRAVSPEVVQGGYGVFVGGTNMSVVFTNLKVTDLSQSTTSTREATAPRALSVSSGRGVEPRKSEPGSGEIKSSGRPFK